MKTILLGHPFLESTTALSDCHCIVNHTMLFQKFTIRNRLQRELRETEAEERKENKTKLVYNSYMKYMCVCVCVCVCVLYELCMCVDMYVCCMNYVFM